MQCSYCPHPRSTTIAAVGDAAAVGDPVVTEKVAVQNATSVEAQQRWRRLLSMIGVEGEELGAHNQRREVVIVSVRSNNRTIRVEGGELSAQSQTMTETGNIESYKLS